ncbi:uncharacterized protein SPAPADRAFT_50354 [Spathaspora passalidarum NRRL Y-27907]|uniref:GPI-anchored protein n=1 Tax=Spathaspora passalidarum (strain NRRL Y-27907 / 11-Y1) TaxID=619300 RepID=G3AMN4_SPAPN|nr:uncharacterized protein SPAPADRAFT_50354 [Spathaspora passalidarum NRRL Y-27907]EGW33478.1 hypothetical protein SPAPADRAFT_50354 [Spathaspora passalidarum NRRL Y-27907]
MKFAAIITIVTFCSFVLAQQITLDSLLHELSKRDLESEFDSMLSELSQRDIKSDIENLLADFSKSDFFSDLSKRNIQLDERGVLDFATSLLGSFNFSSIYGTADEAAGWINNLLSEYNQYVVSGFNLVGSTDLVPISLIFGLGNPVIRKIANEVLSEGLQIALNYDLTPVFVALKDSNLAYTFVADMIKNKNTLPFIESVVSDLISSGALSFDSLLSIITGRGDGSSAAAATTAAVAATTTTTAAAVVVTGTTTVASADSQSSSSSGSSSFASTAFSFVESLFKREESLKDRISGIVKRSNISNLATTIMSALAKSTLLNDTFNYLFTSAKFEQEVVDIISGLLKNLGSLVGSLFSLSLDIPKLLKVGEELLSSGLLTDILSKAFNDPALIQALEDDFSSLIGGRSYSNFTTSATTSSDATYPNTGTLLKALLGGASGSLLSDLFGGSSNTTTSTAAAARATTTGGGFFDDLFGGATKAATTKAAATATTTGGGLFDDLFGGAKTKAATTTDLFVAAATADGEALASVGTDDIYALPTESVAAAPQVTVQESVSNAPAAPTVSAEYEGAASRAGNTIASLFAAIGMVMII